MTSKIGQIELSLRTMLYGMHA